MNRATAGRIALMAGGLVIALVCVRFNFPWMLFPPAPLESIVVADPSLTEVETFSAEARLVGRGMVLTGLSTTRGVDPTPLYTLAPWGPNGARLVNTRIASAPNGDVLTANGRQLLRIAADGTATTALDLDTVAWPGSTPLTPEDEFGFSMECSGGFVFCEVGRSRRHFLVRFSLDDGSLAVLPCDSWGREVAFDPRGTVVYWIENTRQSLRNSTLRASRWTGEPVFSLALDHRFLGSLDLSPDGTRLVASDSDLSDERPIVVIDVTTQESRRLPVEGSDAVWGTDDTLYFLRGEGNLHRYDLATGTETRLLRIRGGRTSANGSFAIAPTISPDGRWLYWRWAIAGRFRGYPRLGPAIIDLERNEIQVGSGDSWSHVTWLPSVEPGTPSEGGR